HPDDFDAALLDHNMPGIDGVQVAARLREIRPGPRMILYTGFHREGLRTRAAQAGVAEILHKPLNRMELAIAIRKALDAKR
ncbi:MAG: response regulator, partial [Desulfobacterales bacterium]|nr:response regulator [Desulfobacterales bacterium]